MKVKESGVGRIRCSSALDDRLQRRRSIRSSEGERTIQRGGLAGIGRKPDQDVGMDGAVAKERDLNNAIYGVREHTWIGSLPESPCRSPVGLQGGGVRREERHGLSGKLPIQVCSRTP